MPARSPLLTKSVMQGSRTPVGKVVKTPSGWSILTQNPAAQPLVWNVEEKRSQQPFQTQPSGYSRSK